MRGQPFDVRFWLNVEKTEGCWNWKGGVTGVGYGHLTRDGKDIGAHRASYEMHKGEIPKGLVVDHLCLNRKCVNPEHLRAVTNRENVLRAQSAPGLPAHNSRKTHCKNGHEFTPCNTILHANGGRICRMCRDSHYQRIRKPSHV
jgi:hypothetical protein